MIRRTPAQYSLGEGGGDLVRFHLAKRGRGLRLAKRGSIRSKTRRRPVRAWGIGRPPHPARLRSTKLCQADDRTPQGCRKTRRAFRQLEIIPGGQRQPWFDELFQLVTEVTEAAAEREGEVDLLEQLVTICQLSSSFQGLPNSVRFRRPSE